MSHHVGPGIGIQVLCESNGCSQHRASPAFSIRDRPFILIKFNLGIYAAETKICSLRQTHTELTNGDFNLDGLELTNSHVHHRISEGPGKEEKMTKMCCKKNLNKKRKIMAKSQCSKHSPAIKLTITVGTRRRRATLVNVECTLQSHLYKASEQTRGREENLHSFGSCWREERGSLRDGLGLYGEKGAFHTLAIVCAS